MGFFLTPSTQSSEGCGRVTERAELPNVPRGLAMVYHLSAMGLWQSGSTSSSLDFFPLRYKTGRIPPIVWFVEMQWDRAYENACTIAGTQYVLSKCWSSDLCWPEWRRPRKAGGPSHWSQQTCVHVRGEAGLDKVILGPHMRRYHISTVREAKSMSNWTGLREEQRINRRPHPRAGWGPQSPGTHSINQ